MSQAAFAALAGATKSAQIKWERESSSSPTAPALAAFADAGADILYILTGTRAADRRADIALDIQDQLAAVRRDLLDPTRDDTTEGSAGFLRAETHAKMLRTVQQADAALLTPAMADELATLLELATDPDKLNEARVQEHRANKARREQQRRRLMEWLENYSVTENSEAMHTLLTINYEYGVPPKLIADLIDQLDSDLSTDG